MDLSDSATLTTLDLNVDLSYEESVELQIPEEECREEQVNPEHPPVELAAFGPVTLEEHQKAVKLGIQKDFEELKQYGDVVKKFQAMYEGDRVMADVDSIIQLCEGVCEKENCNERRRVVNTKLEGGVLSVVYCC